MAGRLVTNLSEDSTVARTDHWVVGAKPLSVAGIRQAVAPILDELAATAHEREERRRHPVFEVRQLAQRGLLLLRLPVADGGAGGTLAELMETVIDIARADSSVAQALRASFFLVDRLASGGSLASRSDLVSRIHQGHLFAGTRNERGGRPGEVTTTVRPDGDGFRLDGAKYYSTGVLYADWFSGNAVDSSGDVLQFTVPTGRDGVEPVDDFNGIGQRLSASGTTRLNNVRVHSDELSRATAAGSGGSGYSSMPQLYLAAVEAGIAQNVLDDAVSFVRGSARPIKHSNAQRSADDPYVRHAVGEIAAWRTAARSVVLATADVLERSYLASADGARVAATEAAVSVAQAQFIAVHSALRAAGLLFEVGGGTATDRTYGFDRHWRNARTIANHNPRAWKAGFIGAFYLDEVEPPLNGLF